MHCDSVVLDADFWSDENDTNVVVAGVKAQNGFALQIVFSLSYLTVTYPEAQGSLMLA